jgi:hypothetical protein
VSTSQATERRGVQYDAAATDSQPTDSQRVPVPPRNSSQGWPTRRLSLRPPPRFVRAPRPPQHHCHRASDPTAPSCPLAPPLDKLSIITPTRQDTRSPRGQQLASHLPLTCPASEAAPGSVVGRVGGRARGVGVMARSPAAMARSSQDSTRLRSGSGAMHSTRCVPWLLGHCGQDVALARSGHERAKESHTEGVNRSGVSVQPRGGLKGGGVAKRCCIGQLPKMLFRASPWPVAQRGVSDIPVGLALCVRDCPTRPTTISHGPAGVNRRNHRSNSSIAHPDGMPALMVCMGCAGYG